MKTNVFFLKEPKTWQLCHLTEMVKLYRSYSINIRVFKEIEGNSYFLKFKSFSMKFESIGKICLFLFSYYKELVKKEKDKLMRDYFIKYVKDRSLSYESCK